MSAVLADVMQAIPRAESESVCFHCGLPVPAHAHWAVEIEGRTQPMCCAGCEAVAQSIVSNGFGDYYLKREAFPDPTNSEALVPAELALYDAPEAAGQFASDGNADVGEATLSVEGIRCAACVWLIERRLARMPGITDANLNVATERLHVRWRKSACKPSDILRTIREIGYAAYPYDPVRHGEQLRRSGKKLSRQLFVAGLAMMQVMMYAVPAYLATDGTMDADMARLMQWASLVLTMPAVFYSALPFFHGAWVGLKARRLGMDVPVALGIAAAFGGSVVATIRGSGEVYFDSITMFIFLLLCSRYLELQARRKAASALEKMQRALPASAARMGNWPTTREADIVPAARLQEGDVILVKPGEAIAADGILLEGETSIDASLLTGESRPLRKTSGDEVPGGAVNISQAMVMRVSRTANQSTLSALMRLIERAGQGKPQLALWADRVAGWFVAALLLLTLVVFAAWQWVDPARSWQIAIAVLVVSCPCALSLATPTVLAAATDRLVRHGVLVVHSHVLETLHRATHIVFDKTGTLTLGRPALLDATLFDVMTKEECLAIAAALETASAHPLATALVDAARKSGEVGIATDIRSHAGKGVAGRCAGIDYRIGAAAFVEELAGACPDTNADSNFTSVYLGGEGKWLARFDLADALRDDVPAMVAWFRSQGKNVVLLSGDRQRVCERIAAAAGIEKAYGDCLPEEKLIFVQDLQRKGAVVAMVGDGVNDAAVLRAADVSFAMGGGAALAQVHADTVLLSGDVSAIAESARIASKTMAVIRQNLAWATLYNAIAIPAAAFGLLNPWLSGIGMSVSSAVVVVNALRLRRDDPRRG
jgi:P-type Cu2+ transporter